MKLKEQLEHQQDDAKTKELEVKMSLKYKKAKFFGDHTLLLLLPILLLTAMTEKKKITRTLAQLAKRVAEEGASEELTAEQLSAQRDLLYVTVSAIPTRHH